MLDLRDLTPRIKQLRQCQRMLQLNKQDIENMLANKRVNLVDLKMMTEYTSDLKHIAGKFTREGRKALIQGFMILNKLVAHTGFEPVISSLRGTRPRPLDECAT
jgi:hypothetical protein